MSDEQTTTKSQRAKKWSKQLLGEAARGIIGNTAHDALKRGLTLLWILVSPWLSQWAQNAVGTAIPTVQGVLSVEVMAPTFTVGSIITIILLVVGVIAIWWFFARKYRTEAKKREQIMERELLQRDQKIEEIEKQLTKKEKLIEQFNEQQKASSERRNELTSTSRHK